MSEANGTSERQHVADVGGNIVGGISVFEAEIALETSSEPAEVLVVRWPTEYGDDYTVEVRGAEFLTADDAEVLVEKLSKAIRVARERGA